MAWETLPTTYKDLIWAGLKKYTQIDNEDGTVSFRDDTHYTNKEQSFFGAKEANKINEAINYIMTKLENGTDLYSEFQAFFNNQKQHYIQSGDTMLEQVKGEVNIDKATFEQFIAELKTESKNRITILENQQKALFDLWFSEIKADLSGDVAGNLREQIKSLEFKTDGFSANDVTFSSDGRTITEKMDSKKIVTEFISDTVIIQKLYEGELLKSTKRITFSNGGKNIKEVIE